MSLEVCDWLRQSDVSHVTTSQGKCALADRLDYLVAPEELSGANAYQCPRCEDLTTARRKINLTHLPPILHFSLLRFVYDAELGDRKKSKAIMEFPARIDMNEWLTAEDSRRTTGPLWYELRGVVEHRGASVSFGLLAIVRGLPLKYITSGTPRTFRLSSIRYRVGTLFRSSQLD